MCHSKPARFIRGNFTKFELLEIVFIVALGFVAFSWVASNLIVDGFDYGFSFSPDRTLQRALHLWDQYGGLGMVSPRAIAGTLPNNLYYSFTQALGVGLHAAQTLIFFTILVGSGVSIFLFYRALGLGERYRHGAVFCALLYMFSPISSTFLWNQFASSYYSYCFIPFIGAAVAYGIRTRRGLLFILLVALTWTVLITSSYMNPVNALMDWLLIGSLLLVLAWRYRSRAREVVKFAVLLAAFWLLLNLVWVLPNADYAAQEFTKADVSVIGVSNLVLLKSNSVPIWQAALQTGYWGLYGTYMGDHWYSWSGLASSPIFFIACLIIALTGLVALTIRPMKDAIVWLGGLALFCLIMINGYYQPFGDALVSLFNQFPQLYAFRSLFQRFGPLLTLCYSLLLGYVMGHLVGRCDLSKIRSRGWKGVPMRGWLTMIWISLVLISISVVAVPYFNGQIIYDGGKVIPSARVQVPSYYAETNKWLNAQEGDFRIFPLPYCRIGYASFSWNHGYWGLDPSSSIFDKVLLTSEYGLVGDLLADIAGRIANSSLDFNLGKMLSILNVRYVLLHEDTNWQFIYGHPWWVASKTNFTQYQAAIEAGGLKPIVSYGKLHLFENPFWHDVHYYQVDTVVAVIGGLRAVKNLTTEPWFDISHMAFVEVDSLAQVGSLPFTVDRVYENYHLLDEPILGGFDNNNTVQTVGRDLPTRHELQIDPHRHLLVFSERFDNGWNMVQGGIVNAHFAVNMLFNGWMVRNDSTSLVLLEFQPQKGVEYCTAFSIGFLLLATTAPILWGRSNRRP